MIFYEFFSVRFTLDEGDDVTWKLTALAEQETLPLFSCRTFEVRVKLLMLSLIPENDSH